MCLSFLQSPVCVVHDLLRVLLVCGDMLYIVVHLCLEAPVTSVASLVIKAFGLREI